jgi:hypothetical protein
MSQRHCRRNYQSIVGPSGLELKLSLNINTDKASILKGTATRLSFLGARLRAQGIF